MGLSRRHFLRNSIAVATGAAFSVAGYSEFLEPHHLTVTRREFPIADLPEAFDGFTIAQISDLHFGAYTRQEEIASTVRLVNSLTPDLAVITGDFITSPEYTNRPPVTHPVYSEVAVCAVLVSMLKAPAGVFACAGNHDASIGAAYVQAALADAGIPLLRNERRALERGGQRLWLAGIADALYDSPDFRHALGGIPAGETAVLLAHEPDVADEARKFAVGLQLSGHSHGGQIRLPLIGAPYLPSLARKYPFGYYRVGSMHLYTNRGIGEILLPYRFNAPPEITLAVLRRGAPARG